MVSGEHSITPKPRGCTMRSLLSSHWWVTESSCWEEIDRPDTLQSLDFLWGNMTLRYYLICVCLCARVCVCVHARTPQYAPSAPQPMDCREACTACDMTHNFLMACFWNLDLGLPLSFLISEAKKIQICLHLTRSLVFHRSSHNHICVVLWGSCSVRFTQTVRKQENMSVFILYAHVCCSLLLRWLAVLFPFCILLTYLVICL